jgi:hypothetical protein
MGFSILRELKSLKQKAEVPIINESPEGDMI